MVAEEPTHRSLTDYSFRDPEHRRFTDLWNDARGDDPMPTRESFPIIKLTDLADTLVIMRIDDTRPGHVIYSGLLAVERWGVGKLGKQVQEVMPPNFVTTWLDIVRKLNQRPCAVFAEMGFDRGEEKHVDSTGLYLPVVNDITHGLYLYTITLPFKLDRKPGVDGKGTEVWCRMTALDIGLGTPFETEEFHTVDAPMARS